MASITKSVDASGETVYKVRASGGRGRRVTRSWKPEPGWSARTTARELNKFAAELENSLADGEIRTHSEEREQRQQEEVERAKIKTLQQYAEQVFLPQKQVSASKKTVYTYRWSFEKYVFPAPLGGMKMGEITPAQLTAFLLDFQASGQAHSSVVRLYAILGGLFKSAYLDDTISANPMSKVSRPRPRKDELRRDGVETLTEPEVVRLLDCLKTEPLKWRTFISLLIETGMRRGECCALQWSNIDFKTGVIEICGSLGYTPASGVYLSTPKSGHARRVNVSRPLLDLLRQLREEQAGTAVSQWCFTQSGNTPEPLHPDSPTRYLKNLGKRYGFEHLHPHLLRHTFASIAIVHGADVVSISEILGHADTAITLRVYSHATEESRKRASEIFLDALAK